MSTTANAIFFFLYIAVGLFNLAVGVLFPGPLSIVNFVCAVWMAYLAWEKWKEWHA